MVRAKEITPGIAVDPGICSGKPANTTSSGLALISRPRTSVIERERAGNITGLCFCEFPDYARMRLYTALRSGVGAVSIDDHLLGDTILLIELGGPEAGGNDP